MDNEEKKYFRDIKGALRKLSEIGVPVTPIIKAVMNAESELAKSEDERIRKNILALVKKHAVNHERCQMEAYLEKQKEPEDRGEISDGYHTFNELYYYRMLYNAAFFNLLPKEWVHKSKRHHDGEECFGGGWFIVMANLPTGQISNHYELKDWDLFQIPEKEIADEWDGHTPQKAAERIHEYLLEKQKEQKPAPDWMPKFLDELRSKKNYFDWDEHRDIEGQILAIINWIAPDYFKRKEEQKPECQDMAVVFPNGNWTELDERRRMLGLPPIDYDALASEQKEPKHEPEDLQKSFEMGQQSIINNPEKYGLCKPAEWSKEDEEILNRLIEDYEYAVKSSGGIGDVWGRRFQQNIDWLKSLRPQPHWKPSEEQMEALESAVKLYKDTHFEIHHEKIVSLYEQLKRL